MSNTQYGEKNGNEKQAGIQHFLSSAFELRDFNQLADHLDLVDSLAPLSIYTRQTPLLRPFRKRSNFDYFGKLPTAQRFGTIITTYDYT
jgi:hypothetical protein